MLILITVGLQIQPSEGNVEDWYAFETLVMI